MAWRYRPRLLGCGCGWGRALACQAQRCGFDCWARNGSNVQEVYIAYTYPIPWEAINCGRRVLRFWRTLKNPRVIKSFAFPPHGVSRSRSSITTWNSSPPINNGVWKKWEETPLLVSLCPPPRRLCAPADHRKYPHSGLEA